MIPRLTGERREVTLLEPVEKELLRSEGSRPVPRNVYISKADLETHGCTSGCIGCCSILKCSSRQGHSLACDKFKKSQQRVNEFLEKASIESEHETKRRRLRAHEPTSVAVSCEPGGTSGSSAGASSAAMDTSEEHGGPKSAQTSCDSEPKSKRAKVYDDIEMGAVSEEMENAECDTLDTRTGEILDPGLVAVARSEEMRYMDDMGMFDDACDEECYSKTGRPPVDKKWVDVNEQGNASGSSDSLPLGRPRRKTKGEPARGDLFAAVHPLEAEKILLSIAASHPWVMRKGRLQRPKLMFIDVKKALLNGFVEPEEYAYVKMPCVWSFWALPSASWMAVWHAPCGKCLGGRLFQQACGVRLDGKRIFPYCVFQHGR